MDTHRRPFNQILDSKSGWGTEYHVNRMGVSHGPRKAAASRGYLDDGELEDGEWPSQDRGTSNRMISSRKEPSHHQSSANKTRSRGKKKAKTDMGFLGHGTSANPNYVPVAPRASRGHGRSPKSNHSPPDAPPPRYSFFTMSPKGSPEKMARGRGE
jgi:hypothetical protein